MELYIAPAARRNEELKSIMPPTADTPHPLGTRRHSEPDAEPGSPEHRKQIIEKGFIGTMGMKREQAEALYEQQLAQWKAEKNGTGN